MNITCSDSSGILLDIILQSWFSPREIPAHEGWTTFSNQREKKKKKHYNVAFLDSLTVKFFRIDIGSIFQSKFAKACSNTRGKNWILRVLPVHNWNETCSTNLVGILTLKAYI